MLVPSFILGIFLSSLVIFTFLVKSGIFGDSCTVQAYLCHDVSEVIPTTIIDVKMISGLLFHPMNTPSLKP